MILKSLKKRLEKSLKCTYFNFGGVFFLTHPVQNSRTLICLVPMFILKFENHFPKKCQH